VAASRGPAPFSLQVFPSLIAIYDALFLRGQLEHLEVMRQAMSDADPGLEALIAGLEASGRWLLANRAVASCCSGAPFRTSSPRRRRSPRASRWLRCNATALADAVAAGELGPEADSEEAVYLISTLIVGVASQAMANEPDLEWGQGRFSPLFTKLMRLLVAVYPRPQPRNAEPQPFCSQEAFRRAALPAGAFLDVAALLAGAFLAATFGRDAFAAASCPRLSGLILLGALP